jgi:hypothetical protein
MLPEVESYYRGRQQESDLVTKLVTTVAEQGRQLTLVTNERDTANEQVRQLGTDLSASNKHLALVRLEVADLKAADYKTAHQWKRLIPVFRDFNEGAIGTELSNSARILGEAMPVVPVKGKAYRSLRTYNLRTVKHYLARLRAGLEEQETND